MSRLYSYVLRIDDGAAPNPFWGLCTLTICKPAIRRTAHIGDWVVGTGSKIAKCSDGKIHNFSDYIVYAMKISDIKSLCDYDNFCNITIPRKIPNWGANDWRQKIGDCIYDYSNGDSPLLRLSVHDSSCRIRDLGGVNALISNEYYYFGEEAKRLPSYLRELIKINQGHKKIENPLLISQFELWIGQFQKNMVYSDPQLRKVFDKQTNCEIITLCSKIVLADNETEEVYS